MTALAAVVEGLSQPFEPLPTGVRARLPRLSGIRAVLFDVYGTLLLSASGDIGTIVPQARARALLEACGALGLDMQIDPAIATGYFLDQIRRTLDAARLTGIEHPEVDIIEVWETTIATLDQQGAFGESARGSRDFARLAIEYECRANPVWPAPGARACLDDLSQRGLTLGLVSNAQFYTPLILDTLMGPRQQALGLDRDLEFYSYQYGQAKPGGFLYQRARERLGQSGIPADAVLYVGNDMLNDVAAAVSAGFRTALYAGDRRSLRWREDDPRVGGIEPDLVVTELCQIPGCLGGARAKM